MESALKGGMGKCALVDERMEEDKSDADTDQNPDTISVSVRSAMTGEQLGEVRLHPEDSVVDLRQAIADFLLERCSLWLLLDSRLLPDRETLQEASVCDQCVVDFIRCQPVPSIAPPPMAPANFEITVRYALTGNAIDKIEIWPTESLASLRERVIRSQLWDGPVQLVQAGGWPLVGPLTLVEAGLFDGVVIDAVRCEPRVLITASADHTARLVSAESGELIRVFAHDEWVNSASTSPDGCYVLTALFNSTAQLWNVETGQEVAMLLGHTRPVLWGAFSPNGQTVGTASYDHTAKLWSVETGDMITDLVGHTDGVLCVAFAPTGQAVATASYDRSAKLWNVETGACTMTFIGHGDEVRSVAFSPDGSSIVTASADQSIMLWDIASGLCTCTLSGHGSSLSSVAFSPHGRFLVTAAADKKARLWDVHNCECVMEFTGHDDVVTSASFSTDGQLVATASADHTTRIWATESGQCVATFGGHSDVVTSVCFASGTSTPKEDAC